MRVEVLSDHPGDMLADAVRERGRGAAGKDEQVLAVRRERDQARDAGRWLAWLRLTLAVWRARRAAAREHRFSRLPSGSEQAILAGSGAEQRVADELGRALGQEWVLFRGYRNSRGEIDGLLLGPRGLFAYEVKYVNATVYIRGDDWSAEKYDKYGNLVEPRRPMIDRGARGRSPGKQLNEPADALADWLRRRGYQAAIGRVVLLAHPNARVGSSRDATVQVTRSVPDLLQLVERTPVTMRARQLAEIAEIIRRDHQHHEKRRAR